MNSVLGHGQKWWIHSLFSETRRRLWTDRSAVSFSYSTKRRPSSLISELRSRSLLSKPATLKGLWSKPRPSSLISELQATLLVSGDPDCPSSTLLRPTTLKATTTATAERTATKSSSISKLVGVACSQKEVDLPLISSISKLVGVACSQKKVALKGLITIDLFNFQASRRCLLSKKT